MKGIILFVFLSAMLITIPSLAGGSMRIAESELTITVTLESLYYQPVEPVNISGIVETTQGSPVGNVSVGIQVLDSKNNTVFLDIAYSMSDGIYNDSFRLNPNSPLGLYVVYVTASAVGYDTARNQTTFTVGSMRAPRGGGRPSYVD